MTHFRTFGISILGIIVTGLTYNLTIIMVARRYYTFGIPTVSEWPALYPFTPFIYGLIVMIVPYVAGGISLYVLRVYRVRTILAVGLFITLSEKALIFLAALYALRRLGNGIKPSLLYYAQGYGSIMGEIQSEALPYFTWTYVLLSIPVSLFVLYLVAHLIPSLFRKNGSSEPLPQS